MIADVRVAARDLTHEALATLRQVMTNPKAPPSARVSAAEAILDRGWGRPTQAVEAKVDLTLERLIVMATERERQLALSAPPLAPALEESKSES